METLQLSITSFLKRVHMYQPVAPSGVTDGILHSLTNLIIMCARFLAYLPVQLQEQLLICL